jgi:pyruvate ferredoxin oxidoreductase alpha subunit
LIYGYIAGLGGRDIGENCIEDIYTRTFEADRPEDLDMWVGVKYVQP